MVGTPRATIHGKFGLIKMVSPKKLWIRHWMVPHFCQLAVYIPVLMIKSSVDIHILFSTQMILLTEADMTQITLRLMVGT